MNSEEDLVKHYQDSILIFENIIKTQKDGYVSEMKFYLTGVLVVSLFSLINYYFYPQSILIAVCVVLAIIFKMLGLYRENSKLLRGLEVYTNYLKSRFKSLSENENKKD
jgi:hypothetical protein